MRAKPPRVPAWPRRTFPHWAQFPTWHKRGPGRPRFGRGLIGVSPGPAWRRSSRGFKIRPFPLSAQPAGGSWSCILAGGVRGAGFGSQGGLRSDPRISLCVLEGGGCYWGGANARPLPCLEDTPPSLILLLRGWADEQRDQRYGAQMLLWPLAQSLACTPSSSSPARPSPKGGLDPCGPVGLSLGDGQD